MRIDKMESVQPAIRIEPYSEEWVALEYASLKRELAVRHSRDREAYTQAKRPFIQRVLSGRSE